MTADSPPLTLDRIERWQIAMARAQRHLVPVEAAPVALAVEAMAAPQAAIIVALMPDGRQHSMALNPVVTMYLIQALQAAARQAGWGDGDSIIISDPSDAADRNRT